MPLPLLLLPHRPHQKSIPVAVSVAVCVALALAHALALVAPVEFAFVITVVVTAIAAADISFLSYQNCSSVKLTITMFFTRSGSANGDLIGQERRTRSAGSKQQHVSSRESSSHTSYPKRQAISLLGVPPATIPSCNIPLTTTASSARAVRRFA